MIIVALAVLLLLSLRECGRRGALADANLDALTDTVRHYKNRLGTLTASKATLQLDRKQMQDYIIKKDAELAALAKEFANVKSVVKVRTELRIDSIPVPYEVAVPFEFERAGKVKDKWYSFGYRSDPKGIAIDSLRIPAALTVITGTKRKWFLGKETVTTDITSDNPHINVTEITAAEVVVTTPWYKKWYVWAAAGFVGGVLASQ